MTQESNPTPEELRSKRSYLLFKLTLFSLAFTYESTKYVFGRVASITRKVWNDGW